MAARRGAYIKDIPSWAELTESERILYKRVLAGLTLLDTKQGNDGIPSMMDLTENFQKGSPVIYGYNGRNPCQVLLKYFYNLAIKA
ncbi:MAG: hypothetical protein ACLT9Y_01640 [Peptostreptococcus anaerobius]